MCSVVEVGGRFGGRLVAGRVGADLSGFAHGNHVAPVSTAYVDGTLVRQETSVLSHVILHVHLHQAGGSGGTPMYRGETPKAQPVLTTPRIPAN